MARGRGREHFLFNPVGVPQTPRLHAAPQAPKEPGTPKMIRKSDGTLVPPYQPRTKTDAGIREAAKQSFDSFAAMGKAMRERGVL